MAAPELDIKHDGKQGRFHALVDGLQCELDYRLDGQRMLFTHTGVPPRLEGRGIAAQLVKQGLEWAKAQSLQVVPLCSYVQTYLRRHPEYQSLTLDRKAN